ncbi:LysR substrate-binding domain-containing protein [Streptomyces griseofuscus]|uniref:LysR substrate-binding domain-containing protein n=1 Tax=Streptomyces griseofuscus TaxID=146922 RepID=UPI003721E790
MTLPELADRAWVRCAMEPVVHGVRFLDRCGRAGFAPRTAVWTEQSSTAVRMAAARVGVCAAPTHIVRGAVGEDCVLLTPDPSWRRPLAVYGRTESTGATARLRGPAARPLARRSGLPERPERLPLTPA